MSKLISYIHKKVSIIGHWTYSPNKLKVKECFWTFLLFSKPKIKSFLLLKNLGLNIFETKTLEKLYMNIFKDPTF